MRDVVRAAVLGQQERARGGGGRVVPRCGPVFEEVEEGEGGEEEGGAPEWRGEVGCERDERDRDAEEDTKREGPEGDAAEGFGTTRAVGWVVELGGWWWRWGGGEVRGGAGGVAVCEGGGVGAWSVAVCIGGMRVGGAVVVGCVGGVDVERVAARRAGDRGAEARRT